MGPEAAFARRVGVALLVSVLVMRPMCRDPEDRTTFKSQGAAYGQKIFHPLGSFLTAIRKKPMVSHTYAKTSGDTTQTIASRSPAN